jgi:hypothetical protein
VQSPKLARQGGDVKGEMVEVQSSELGEQPVGESFGVLLDKLGIIKHEKLLATEDVKSAETLLLLSEDDLRAIGLGIGPRRIILNWIKESSSATREDPSCGEDEVCRDGVQARPTDGLGELISHAENQSREKLFEEQPAVEAEPQEHVHEEHAPQTDEQAGGWFSSWFASGDGGNEAMEKTIAVPGDMASNVAELTTAVEALRTHPHIVHDRTVGAMQVLLPCFSHQPDPGDVSARLNAAAW